MQYRQMGKWGVKLSSLGLGSWMSIGGACAEDDSIEMVRAAYEAGVNFFDTADSYGSAELTHGRGQAEELLGRALRDIPRSAVVLLTKVCSQVGPGPNDKGLSAKHIKESCESSLRRLNTDYLDIYMFHRPDPTTPLEESIRAFEDLARQGKILYFGVSMYSAAQMEEYLAVAKEIGARPIGVNEPRYNLLYRKPEHEVFPTTRRNGIGNVTFSPTAHGILTGKYKPGVEPPAGSRAADPKKNWFLKKLYWNDACLQAAQDFASLAGDMGVTASQLAIAWILHNPDVTSAIVGATSMEQLTENLGAAEVTIPPDVAARIEELFPLKDYYPDA